MIHLREWFARQKERSNKQRRKEVTDCFQLKEMWDSICIVHNADVICDFEDNATIADVMSVLKKKRETALKYAKI